MANFDHVFLCFPVFFVFFFFTFISSRGFFAAKIEGFGVALKNPSLWKSVARLVEQVGRAFGRFVPLYIRRVFAENKPKMVEIYMHNLISMPLTPQICTPEICTHHFFFAREF